MAHRLTDPRNILLHKDALEYAKELIKKGRVNCDVHNWTIDQPTPIEKDSFLADHNFSDYGRWFLAVREKTPENTREHYEFPLGNFREIYRSGIVSAKARAGQYRHEKIEKAASELLELIDKTICKA